VNTRVVYDSENSVIANGLSVDIKASAELSQPERDALVRLAAGFEHAIQGLNLEKTKTDIEELLQFDSSIFESIDLKAKFNDPADSPFSFEFHADMNQRHLSIELSKNLQTDKKGGKLEIDVNLKEPELFADESKKNKAMDNYLKQIDQTAGRAKSKEVAIDIFKQSLISAHQLYPAAPAKPVEEKSADKPIAVIALDEKLADQDLALLSGMADFKAGLNIEGKSNPFRPAETVDHLKYDMSQETTLSGKENRHVGQVQKSDLDASVHTQLDSSKAVQLTENKYSQSYDLHRMKDHAESVVSLDYEKNNIIKASIEKSADQSSQFERFILGKQTKEKHSSLHHSVNDDLLPLLEPLVKTAESGSSAYRMKKLLELNQNIELENNPDLLKITKPR
jgi:hypothetical protein